MSKPESIKIDPWTTFPTQKYSFINDGFVEGKSAVLKLSTRNRRSAVNIK